MSVLMSVLKKKELPFVILTIVGLFFILAYYFPLPLLASVEKELRGWVIIMGIFLNLLGVVSLTIKEYGIIRKRLAGWESSAWFLVVLIITVVVFFYAGSSGKDPFYTYFDTLFTPLDTGMYSLLTFMVIAAFFRVFRVRSWESFLLVASLVFVMLMNAPVGEAMWSGFPAIGQWITTVPAMGASRASEICIALGGIILMMRIILGLEKRIM